MVVRSRGRNRPKIEHDQAVMMCSREKRVEEWKEKLRERGREEKRELCVRVREKPDGCAWS